MKRLCPVFFLSILFCASVSLAQTGGYTYTPPEPDIVKIKFVSQPTKKIVWAPKPKPDWAKQAEEAQAGSQGGAPATPEADWKKYMPKDPVCETTKGKAGEQIDVWTVDGWSPVEFNFTAPDGEFPITTRFTVFPNQKEIQLESSGSIGSAWTLKDSDGVKAVEKPVVKKDKKKDKKKSKDKSDEKPKAESETASDDTMMPGKPVTVTWSLAELTKPTATANFVFNYRGKDVTAATVTIVKKAEEKEKK